MVKKRKSNVLTNYIQSPTHQASFCNEENVLEMA